MALDSMTGQKLADRVLFEIGRKVPDGELPADWWIDCINEEVDKTVFQIRNISGNRFLYESAGSVVSNAVDMSSFGIVPWTNKGKQPETIEWIVNDTGDKIMWMDRERGLKINDLPQYDSKVYWDIKGNSLIFILGDSATAPTTCTVCHQKRRTAITVLSGSIDLDREYLAIVKNSMQIKALERLKALGYNIRDAELGEVKKAYMDELEKAGVQIKEGER